MFCLSTFNITINHKYSRAKKILNRKVKTALLIIDNYSIMEDKRSYKVIIGVTGSVATIKLPILIDCLMNLNNEERNYNFQVQIICTERAKHFIKVTDLPQSCSLLDDAAEWNAWNGRGDPVFHVELGKWADMLVIAPLDANTLAKISTGICDNLLTCTVRAWNHAKPLIFCPAMNTRMFCHPITATQISTLCSWGYEEIPPIEKQLMCGDLGMGAMAELNNIVQRIKAIADSSMID